MSTQPSPQPVAGDETARPKDDAARQPEPATGPAPHTEGEREEQLDEALDESFPASDPPSQTVPTVRG